MKVNLNLTPEQINVCLTALHQGPYNQVVNVINSIEAQLNSYVKSLQEDKSELAKVDLEA